MHRFGDLKGHIFLRIQLHLMGISWRYLPCTFQLTLSGCYKKARICGHEAALLVTAVRVSTVLDFEEWFRQGQGTYYSSRSDCQPTSASAHLPIA